MGHSDHRSPLPVPPEAVYAWHARPGSFERLVPPWADIRLRRRVGGVATGARLELDVKLGPVPVRWVAAHVAHEPGRSFVDVQERGPFAEWRHEHRFEPAGAGSILHDHVDYALPAGASAFEWLVDRELARMFAYRHARTADDLARHAAFPSDPLRVLVTGGSGLVGTHLLPFLTSGGHAVIRAVRREPAPASSELRWDPEQGRLDRGPLDGVHAVIHLAGEPMLGGFWTAERRRKLIESRIAGTALLARTLAKLPNPPRVLVAASSTGFYGDRADELDEDGPVGEGWFAEMARAWEAATAPAADAGIRVVNVRIGTVWSGRGGLLPAFAAPVRMGLGGPWGTGEQWVSWIGVDDLVGVLHQAIFDERLRGPVNAVAPEPVRNRDFARSLADVLGRPSRLRVPRWAVRGLLGRELADALVLESRRVRPRKLQEVAFRYSQPRLEDVLRQELGRIDTEAPRPLDLTSDPVEP